MDIEKQRMLTKVSSLYYNKGLNQQEITDRLGISRPQISRMLSQARAEGIVSIVVKDQFAEENEYEQALVELFPVKDAVLIDTAKVDHQAPIVQIGRAAAELMESKLKNTDVLGVNAGITVNAVGEQMQYVLRSGLSIVPLVGGWGADGNNWQANMNAKLIAEKLNAKYWQFNSPAVLSSSEARDILMKEPEISNVLGLARSATVALVGIGQVSEHSTIYKCGMLGEDSLNELKGKDAVASVCSSFLDKDGRPVEFSAGDRMIGITVEELRQIPHVLAVSAGTGKADAILATLKGGWIDTLITDLDTAKEIMKKAKPE